VRNTQEEFEVGKEERIHVRRDARGLLTIVGIISQWFIFLFFAPPEKSCP